MSFCLIFTLLLSSCWASLIRNDAKEYILPQGTGPYRSHLQVLELVDHKRLDPYNTTHVRRLMVSIFTPVSASTCHLTKTLYMPPVIALTEDEILAEYGYPKGLWSRFVLQVCNCHPATTIFDDGNHRRKFPLALFSPGLNTTRLFYSSLAQEIASQGFIVVTIDHPYDVDVVQFPNGDVIYGGVIIPPRQPNDSTTSVEHALEVRAQDVSFVLDTLKVEDEGEALMFGQSFGGAASATSMLRDKRIRAGANIDGAMFGPVLSVPLGSPTQKQAYLLWGSDGHNSSSDAGWGQFWDTLGKAEHEGFVDYRKEMSISKSVHGSYWDLNILVDVAGVRENLSDEALMLIGPIEGARIWKILGKYLSSFFDYALGRRSEYVGFKRPIREFPEVVLVH
jgi:hypothetical protein